MLNPKRIQRLPLLVPLPPGGETGGMGMFSGAQPTHPQFPSLPFSPSPTKGGLGFFSPPTATKGGGGGFLSPPPSAVAAPPPPAAAAPPPPAAAAAPPPPAAATPPPSAPPAAAPQSREAAELQARLNEVERMLREANEVEEKGRRAGEARALFLAKVRQRYFAWSVRRMRASVSSRMGPRFNSRGITLGGLRAYQAAHGGVGGALDALSLGELSRGASQWVEQTPLQFALANPRHCGPGRVYVSMAAGVEGTTLGGLIVALGQWEEGLTHPPPTPFTYILEVFNTPPLAPGSPVMGEEDGAWWTQVHCKGVRKVGKVVVVLGMGDANASRDAVTTTTATATNTSNEWEWEWRAMLECGWISGVTVDFALPTPLPEFFQGTLSRGSGAWRRALGRLTPPVQEGIRQLRGVFADEPAVNPRVVVRKVERGVRVWLAERGREWLMGTKKVEGGRVCVVCWANVGALFAGLGRVGVSITLYKSALEEGEKGECGDASQFASWRAVIERLEAKRVGSATNLMEILRRNVDSATHLMEILRRNIVLRRGVGGVSRREVAKA